VAIKQVLVPELAQSDSLRQQVRAEAAMHKRVSTDHPKHLVKFIDLIENEHGLLLISEFIDGPTLENRLSAHGRPHDERAALGIVAATAKALDELHKAGVVHRDLKPANILLPRDGGLKLADFGLAAVVGTAESLPVGTVRYMAPELLRGEPATAASDLYSLGMIAYELLAGRERFDQAFRTVLRDQRNPAMRWMKWHTNERLSAPALSTVLPKTPETLSEMVARMMDKDRARRIGTAKEVLSAIRRHFVDHPESDKGEPTGLSAVLAEADDAEEAEILSGPTTPMATTPGHTAKLPKSKLRLTIVLVAVLSLLATVAFVVIGMDQRAQRLEQERRLALAADDLNLAYEMLKQGRFDNAQERYNKLIEQWPAGTDIGDRAARGILLTQGERAYAAEDWGRAVELFQEYDRTPSASRELVADKLRTAQRQLSFEQAIASINAQTQQGQFGSAREALAQWRGASLSDAERDRLSEIEQTINAAEVQARERQLIEEVTQLAEQGKRDEAIARLETRRTLSPDTTAVLERLRREQAFESNRQQAQQAEDHDALPEAIDFWKRAIELNPQASDEITPRINRLEAVILAGEAAKAFDEGKLIEAAAKAEQALSKDPDNKPAQELARRTASVARQQTFLAAGEDALGRGDYEAAMEQFTKAFEIEPLEQVLRKLNTARGLARWQQGMTVMGAGDNAQATELFTSARSLLPNEPRIADAIRELEGRVAYAKLIAEGDAARDAGNYGNAKRAYRKALELRDTEQVRGRINEADYLDAISLARRYIDQKEWAAARAKLDEAARIEATEEVQRLLERIEQGG
jgi:hypothetical protein